MINALSELRRQFADQLMDRFEAIREQMRRVATTRSPADAEVLHRQVHSITGAAGTFGMHSLSDAARTLETRLAQIIKGGDVPDDQAWTSVLAEVERLQELARRHLEHNAPSLTPPEPTARLDRTPLVDLVEDDAEQAEHLSRCLREAGYQVRAFTSLKDFRAAYRQETPPDALVLDMIFPEGDSAGARLLAELKADPKPCPPVVFISVRDDIDARLAAYRAGASRYLSS